MSGCGDIVPGIGMLKACGKSDFLCELCENEAIGAERDALAGEVESLKTILRGEQAVKGAFGKTRLWGALDTVLDAKATEDELDQIMRLLNANSKGIDTAMEETADVL